MNQKPNKITKISYNNKNKFFNVKYQYIYYNTIVIRSNDIIKFSTFAQSLVHFEKSAYQDI